MISFSCKCKTHTLRKRDYRKGIYDTTIDYEYNRLFKHLTKRHPEETLVLPEDIAGFLSVHLVTFDSAKWNDYSIDDIIALTEKSCFSGKQISKETADLLIKFYRYARKH